jgi:hypothetical protein
MQPRLPQVFTISELDAQAGIALGQFVQTRLAEGTGPYRRWFARNRPLVARLFAATNNLRGMDAEALCAAPALIEAARYLAGPPLSEDDLDTLSRSSVSKRTQLDAEAAARAVQTLKAFLDPLRCPWLASGVGPSAADVRKAIDWTASLWAVEKCRTSRRRQSSAAQEREVADLLLGAGIAEEIGLRRIAALDDIPRRRFCREIRLGPAKTDPGVRLADGRLMAIECKVTNSALNSVRRLNREVGGKAEGWRRLYGQQVITAAVLSGVFRVGNLAQAQDAGVFLFWSHDLAPLHEFVQATCG